MDDATLPWSPPVEDHLRLRGGAGLHAKSQAQVAGAVQGSWASCHVRTLSGMSSPWDGRSATAVGTSTSQTLSLIPSIRGWALGGRVVAWLLEDINHRAADGAYVSLTASSSGSTLFESPGFRPVVSPQGLAMEMVMSK
jgi:hypothetical protein